MTQARSSDQSPKADTEPEEVVRDEPELTGGRQPSLALTVRRGGQSKTPSLAISATWNLIHGLKCVKNGMKEEMKQQNFPWFFISGVSNFLFAVGHTSQDAWWLQDDQVVQMTDLVFWCVLPLLAQVRGNGSLQLSEKVDENQLGVRTCRMMQTFFLCAMYTMQ